MLVRKYTDITEEEVDVEGARGVGIRVLISEDDGAPNFIMRRFSVQPGGHTPCHSHDWEHEVFVLAGRGRARQGDSGSDLEPGSVVLVVPEEEHCFENTGDEPLVFLCLIPK